MKNFNLLNDEIKDLERISKNLSEIIVLAFDFARRRESTIVEGKDVFVAILNHKKNIAGRLLTKLGVDLTATLQGLKKVYKPSAMIASPVLGEDVQKLLSKSYLISSELNHVYVGSEHMLLAILSNKDWDFVKGLAANGLNYEAVKSGLINFGIYQPGVFSSLSDQNAEDEEEVANQGSLYYFAQDMNNLAAEGKYLKVWGRSDEIERMIHILSRRTKNNPILVGEAGVGKTAIVQGLVQRIVAGKVPGSFKNKKIVQLDLSSIIAGSKIRGDIEERLLGIVSEMTQDPDLILFIDEIHMIVGAGAAGAGSSMDVANILKPHLTSGNLRVIGATTYDEYQKYIEEDDALARRFQPVTADEISSEDAVKVLKMLRPSFEEFHNVKVTDDALEVAVELSDRYITDKYLPDKAIDVLDEASAAKKIKLEKTNNKEELVKQKIAKLSKQKEKLLNTGKIKESVKLRTEETKLQKKLKSLSKVKKMSFAQKDMVDTEEIRAVIASWSKIPVTTMESNEVALLKKTEASLSKRIIGQSRAISKISATLKRARIGLGDINRPLASFLFLGPTGVGKSETAKEIARTIFGGEDALIQVDMSEYMEQHSVSKLIGSPPGYIGYQEGGHLTEQIRRKPYSVVLFDEMEKAHPDLLNILLQILEEGRLQDSKGREINFKNSIIIMTSNIGASEISNDGILGFGIDKPTKKESDGAFERMRVTLMDELKDNLPPEFLNRIDDTIIFRGLDEKDTIKITEILIKEINIRLKSKKVQIVPTRSVIAYIAKEGFSKEYGARNIKRKLQELIENPLADYIIDRRIDFNNKSRSTILVKIQKNKDGIKLI